MAKHLALLLALALLPACVGGTLSDTKAFEMFPLRAATTDEGPGLKTCLKAAHKAQEHYRKKTGQWARRVKQLPIDQYCGDYLMSQSGTPSGWEIKAEIRENETAVRWSVNERGVIEEHLEGGEGDEYLEL